MLQLLTDYFFEQRGDRYLLTMYGKGLKEGSNLTIKEGTFSITQIEYYLDPPDLFVAELVKIC
jgi:hypothetical protein